MLQHSLRTAHLAEDDGATTALVAAALLHDIGHLLLELPGDLGWWGSPHHHEQVGAAFLARYFIPAVSEPVRLHVAAKRYLCAVDLSYMETLSDRSWRSLAEQGGPFSPDEVRAFDLLAYGEDALLLRYYDDDAHDSWGETRELEHYRQHLEASLRAAEAVQI